MRRRRREGKQTLGLVVFLLSVCHRLPSFVLLCLIGLALAIDSLPLALVGRLGQIAVLRHGCCSDGGESPELGRAGCKRAVRSDVTEGQRRRLQNFQIGVFRNPFQYGSENNVRFACRSRLGVGERNGSLANSPSAGLGEQGRQLGYATLLAAWRRGAQPAAVSALRAPLSYPALGRPG